MTPNFEALATGCLLSRGAKTGGWGWGWGRNECLGDIQIPFWDVSSRQLDMQDQSP